MKREIKFQRLSEALVKGHAEWLDRLREQYQRTGAFPAEELRELLGSQRKSVDVPRVDAGGIELRLVRR